MAKYKGVKGVAKVKTVSEHYRAAGLKEIVLDDKRSLCVINGPFILKEDEIKVTAQTVADAINVRQQIKVRLTKLVPILQECLQYFENQSYEVKNEHLENELKKILRREKK